MNYKQRAIMKAIDKFNLAYTKDTKTSDKRAAQNKEVSEFKQNVQKLFALSSMDVLFNSSQDKDIATKVNERVLLNNQITHSPCWGAMRDKQYPEMHWLYNEINEKVWPNYLFKKMMTKNLPALMQAAENRLHNYHLGSLKSDSRFSALLLEHLAHAFWEKNSFTLTEEYYTGKQNRYGDLGDLSVTGMRLSLVILAILGCTIGVEYAEIHRAGEVALKPSYESWREDRYDEIAQCEIACMIAAGIFLISLIGLCYGVMQWHKAENDRKFVQDNNNLASRISQDMFGSMNSAYTINNEPLPALLQWSAEKRGVPVQRATVAPSRRQGRLEAELTSPR